MAKRFFALLFFAFTLMALWQCANRGNPSGGPKDVDPPVLLRTEPANLSTNFKGNKIRLYFDEYIKLQDVQEQLIISPPLKYRPEISPLGGPSKYVEIRLKDTLRDNTTYTLNFGQSIVDNNEGNPYPYLSYVFSTGDYIDSLSLSGAVKDAYNKKADPFISILLYEIDTAYTDSTIYRKLPNYMANTLDSLITFKLNNLKKGKYKLFAIKDEGKNNVFDQNADKIAFSTDTITLPTDSTYLLTLFKETPDYKASVPSFSAANKISFGYYGEGDDIGITPLTPIPDSVRTTVLREREKDTFNFWFTPFETDSIQFTVTNESLKLVDTFTVKTRKLEMDSLRIVPENSGPLEFNKPFTLLATTPLRQLDTTKISMMDKDSVAFYPKYALDTLLNQLSIDFPKAPEENYSLELLPGALTDFFGVTHDTLGYRLSTNSLADYGTLRIRLEGPVVYPVLVQLTNEGGETLYEIHAEEEQLFSFDLLEPANYYVRVVFDTNGNKKWDTGNYLKGIQPEKVSYYPDLIDVRANWELEQIFTLLK